MINLMPPALKEQLAFSKRNTTILAYLRSIVLIIIAALFLSLITFLYLNYNYKKTTHELTDRQTKINSYANLEEKAKALDAQLANIKKVQGNQNKYSTLLQEIANLTPNGVYITSLSLTGDVKKPAKISAIASSYGLIAAFRNALATSRQIQGVDIHDITTSPTGGYGFDFYVALKSGAIP